MDPQLSANTDCVFLQGPPGLPGFPGTPGIPVSESMRAFLNKPAYLAIRSYS